MTTRYINWHNRNNTHSRILNRYIVPNVYYTTTIIDSSKINLLGFEGDAKFKICCTSFIVNFMKKFYKNKVAPLRSKSSVSKAGTIPEFTLVNSLTVTHSLVWIGKV